MNKVLLTSFLTFFLMFNANSGTDGVNQLSKNKPKDVIRKYIAGISPSIADITS